MRLLIGAMRNHSVTIQAHFNQRPLMSAAGFERNVFVNRPFSQDYREKQRAIVFVLIRLGLRPCIASQEADSGEARIDKIKRLIRHARREVVKQMGSQLSLPNRRQTVKKLIFCGSLPVYFITCKDVTGRQSFAYLFSNALRMDHYNQVRSGISNLHALGTVIASAFGIEPPPSMIPVLEEYGSGSGDPPQTGA